MTKSNRRVLGLVAIIALAGFSIAVLIGAIFLLWKLPESKANSVDVSPKERIELENATRASLNQSIGIGVQSLTGIAVIVGGYVAWQKLRIDREIAENTLSSTQETLRLSQENAANSLRHTQETLRLSEDGQITGRFTHAIDQLGSDNLAIRLGAIHALERIARDSARDLWQIMEILTAFVRETSVLNPPEEVATREKAMVKKSFKLRADLQAALNTIGRCNAYVDDSIEQELDLSGANLSGGRFKEFVQKATFQNVDFSGSTLKQAIFEEVNLQKTSFVTADLQGALFVSCILSNAQLVGADLQQAIFVKTDLQDSMMIFADLRGASLKEAINLELKHIKTAIGDSKTSLPKYLHPYKDEILSAWESNYAKMSNSLKPKAELYRLKPENSAVTDED
jgi:hypothetical protein